jgi:uncharacterized protein YecE (DUF72 family)
MKKGDYPVKASIYLGTQGWIYEGWEGPFYPRKTSPKEMLRLYSRIFNTVEIDSTFYAIPAKNTVAGWYERTPKNFKFCVKIISEITHKKRLRDVELELKSFLERIRLLGEKLGAILIQLPPDFSPAEFGSLRSFLTLLPRDLFFTVEFRDSDWLKDDRFLEELKAYNVAVALTDSRWIDRKLSLSLVEHPTSTFSYVRWLGPRELTDFSRVQIDRAEEMKLWARGFQLLSTRVDVVFGYFNNHFQGHSPASCTEFKQILGLPTISPDELIIQPSLF